MSGKPVLPLFKKPFGGSEKWCNQHMSTTRGVLCEVCGKSHLDLPDGAQGYSLNQFLGRQMIGECCGGVLDVIFDESGREIAFAYIKECAKEPTSSEFKELLFFFKDILALILKSTKRLEEEVEKTDKMSEEIISFLKNKI